MEIVAYYLVSFLLTITIVIYAWKLLDWAWFRPRKLEKCLRKQGLKGNSYKLIFGDLKELAKSFEDANSKPLKVSDDDICPRIVPYFVDTIKKHGKFCFRFSSNGVLFTCFEVRLIQILTEKSHS